jgi:hypothetical protein
VLVACTILTRVCIRKQTLYAVGGGTMIYSYLSQENELCRYEGNASGQVGGCKYTAKNSNERDYLLECKAA